jgi:hypothetical protein
VCSSVALLQLLLLNLASDTQSVYMYVMRVLITMFNFVRALYFE